MTSSIEQLRAMSNVLGTEMHPSPGVGGAVMFKEGLFIECEQTGEGRNVRIIGTSAPDKEQHILELRNPTIRVVPEDSDDPRNKIGPQGALLIDPEQGIVVVLSNRDGVKVDSIGLPGIRE